MTEIKCFNCNDKIIKSDIRLFLDQNKKQQVCKKCWEKECDLRFTKTNDKTPNEVIKELADKNRKFIKAIDFAEQKRGEN